MKSVGILIAGIGFEDGTSVWDVAYVLREMERRSIRPVPLVPRESVEKKIPGSRRKKAPIRDFAAEAKLMVRGDVFFMDEYEHRQLDAVLVPGGKGAVKVLSSIMVDGSEALVLPEVREIIAGAYARKKPLIGLGYGSALIAFVLRSVAKPIVTVGDDMEMAELLKKIGGDALKVQPHEVIYDEENNIFTTPGTSPRQSLYRASLGIERLIEEIAEPQLKSASST